MAHFYHNEFLTPRDVAQSAYEGSLEADPERPARETEPDEDPVQVPERCPGCGATNWSGYASDGRCFRCGEVLP